MVNNIALRFLGTSSQTNVTRNYSSLLVKLDHHTVMVDCGESTQRQLQNRYVGGEEKMGSIRRILITHLHMDHVSGLVPLLCSMMGPSNALFTTEKTPRVEIFGPSGLRALLRSTFTLCYATLSGYYTVHELLWPSQSAYPNKPLTSTEGDVVGASMPESEEALLGATNGPRRTIPHLPPHENELPGKDFRLDEETASWPHITVIDGVNVSAAPILHRCPTVGFIFNEAASSSTSVTPEILTSLKSNAAALEAEQGVKNPKSLLGKLLKERQAVELPDGTILEPPPLDVRGRKVVILGDTYDATAGLEASEKGVEEGGQRASTRGMLALAQDADVLVHECTNAALPAYLQPGNKKVDEKREEVRAKALLRGHSTPQVAGQFAAKCGARQLLLNHIGVKYPASFGKGGHPVDPIPFRPSNGDAGQTWRPQDERERRFLAIRDIEQQATESWHEGLEQKQSVHVKSAQARRAIAAFDGYMYRVEKVNAAHAGPNGGLAGTLEGSGSGEEDEDEGQWADGSAKEQGLPAERRIPSGPANGAIPTAPHSMATRGTSLHQHPDFRGSRASLRGRGQGRPQPVFRGGPSARGGLAPETSNYYSRGNGRGGAYSRGNHTPSAPTMASRGQMGRGRGGGWPPRQG